MSINEVLLLFLMALLAFISPYVSKKIFLPIPVVEILFGIALGAFYHIEEHSFTVVKFISEFGFLVLMYLAGLELDIEDLKKISKRDFVLYLLYYFLIICLVFVGGYIFKIHMSVLLVLTMTAIGMLFPILIENGILDSYSGRVLLIIGSIGEIISLLIITIVTIYYNYGLNTKGLFHLFQILLFCLFAFFALKSFKLFSWWYPNIILKIVSSDNSAETGMRTNFLNMLLFVALAAFLNIEIIIGSFIGGMLYATVLKENESIREGFEMFGNGFLIPIFFIYVGLSFDISSLTNLNVIVYSLLITICLFIVRLLASVVFVFSDINIRSLILIPLGTSFPLTLLVAFAEIGKSSNFLSDEIVSSIILTSILTSMLYPPIFKIMLKYSK